MAITEEQKGFIKRVGDLAAADMKKSGILASLTIAQAILESGWGQSGLTVKANALFGIKAGSTWKGKVYSAQTQECYDGVSNTTITALFRAYDSWEESVSDHSALLTGLSRYKAVVGERDYKKACVAIRTAGYATDPTYSDKLINLIDSYGLAAYDSVSAPPAGSNNNAKGAVKMTSTEFISKLQNIVDHYKTLYVMGCFGAPLTAATVQRYCTNDDYNKQAARTAMIKAAANQNPPVFGFDCVCLIKGVLWGWSGDASKTYGGAGYAVNGVPDISADTMITKCTGVSTDFKNIVPGEAVWLSGHIGVYIGGGKVIECTPAFKNCVQVTACLNIGAISGLNGRAWTKHGKLPYITYDSAGNATPPAQQPGKPAGSGNTSAPLSFSVGDVVRFTGNTHYTSANATSGPACKPGTAKVTQIATGTKHPYHLINVSGGGSTVYGWVDAADVQAASGGAAATIKAGSVVKVKAGAKTYTGGSLASFVYSREHVVKEISNDRAVITYGGVVVAAVKVSDLTFIR
ncbi:glycoside hydrolase family 73 protein [Caproiciproducens sp. CPB-2]|uniref:glycoside hydrolase family 73 protein n=1 Tax=Caproiciproducens sp. CPB-2 TaxID=3030017 RepID=UPI0023DAD081|nr:glycoside hydrolase family 73 protein [Caproiciproducens sp. CPB-2]MDF1494068.1 glycoside hydrolase family 73 protein [Caproiciproducens sp. CPB-2]